MTGDRNVPAGKVTLFTLDEAPTLGHYTGTELVDEGDTQPRPVGAQRSGPCMCPARPLEWQQPLDAVIRRLG